MSYLGPAKVIEHSKKLITSASSSHFYEVPSVKQTKQKPIILQLKQREVTLT